MSPPWELVIQVFYGGKLHEVEDENALKNSNLNRSKTRTSLTHEANCGSCEDPAELPPTHGVVTNHVFNSIVESLDSIAPRNGNAFKEDQEKKTETADGVRVEYLENVHATLCNTCEANKVADNADASNEEFLAATEKLRPLVYHGSDKAFHRTELRVKTDEKKHKEEETRP